MERCQLLNKRDSARLYNDNFFNFEKKKECEGIRMNYLKTISQSKKGYIWESHPTNILIIIDFSKNTIAAITIGKRRPAIYSFVKSEELIDELLEFEKAWTKSKEWSIDESDRHFLKQQQFMNKLNTFKDTTFEMYEIGGNIFVNDFIDKISMADFDFFNEYTELYKLFFCKQCSSAYSYSYSDAQSAQEYCSADCEFYDGDDYNENDEDNYI